MLHHTSCWHALSVRQDVANSTTIGILHMLFLVWPSLSLSPFAPVGSCATSCNSKQKLNIDTLITANQPITFPNSIEWLTGQKPHDAWLCLQRARRPTTRRALRFSSPSPYTPGFSYSRRSELHLATFTSSARPLSALFTSARMKPYPT
jgi:hypothetical protein